jgi:hypothetical protein
VDYIHLSDSYVVNVVVSVCFWNSSRRGRKTVFHQLSPSFPCVVILKMSGSDPLICCRLKSQDCFSCERHVDSLQVRWHRELHREDPWGDRKVDYEGENVDSVVSTYDDLGYPGPRPLISVR